MCDLLEEHSQEKRGEGSGRAGEGLGGVCCRVKASLGLIYELGRSGEALEHKSLCRIVPP